MPFILIFSQLAIDCTSTGLLPVSTHFSQACCSYVCRLYGDEEGEEGDVFSSETDEQGISFAVLSSTARVAYF